VKYRPKTKPFPHQSRATLRAVRHRNFGIFMEPRTGKSKVALDYTGVLATKGEVLRVAIVCPKAALEVWEQQIELHFPYPYRAQDHESEWFNTHGLVPFVVEFYLLAHERLSKRGRLKAGQIAYAHAGELKGKWRYPYLDDLAEFDPDLVIDDESHRHKRPGGVGAQALWRFVERMRARRRAVGDTTGRPYVLLLSGTPNPKGWRDLFAQFRIMDSSVFGTNANMFDEDYCVYGMGSKRFSVVRYQNKRELLRKIRSHSITVTEEEAGLAKKQFWQRLHVQLPPNARRMYDEVVSEFITEAPSGEIIEAKNAGVVRLRLLQITAGVTTQGEQLHNAKTDRLREYLQLLVEQNQNVVVYCRFTPEVERALTVARRVGYRVFRYDGKASKRERSAGRNALHPSSSLSDVRALVVQVQAGSVAMDFSAAAEAVYVSLPDGWEAFRQSYARLLGPNQKRPVRYSVIVARGTLDPSLIRSLRKKEDTHAEMMRNPRRYLLGL
jgi:hypothetical protein